MNDTNRARELESKICAEIQKAWPMRPQSAVLALILAELQAKGERTIEECKTVMCDFDCQEKPAQCKDPCGACKAMSALKERKDADEI
jgi:hypothetical protein